MYIERDDDKYQTPNLEKNQKDRKRLYTVVE